MAASKLDRYVVAMRRTSEVCKPCSTGLHRWLHTRTNRRHWFFRSGRLGRTRSSIVLFTGGPENYRLLRVCTVHDRIANARIVVIRCGWEEGHGSVGCASFASRRTGLREGWIKTQFRQGLQLAEA